MASLMEMRKFKSGSAGWGCRCRWRPRRTWRCAASFSRIEAAHFINAERLYTKLISKFAIFNGHGSQYRVAVGRLVTYAYIPFRNGRIEFPRHVDNAPGGLGVNGADGAACSYHGLRGDQHARHFPAVILFYTVRPVGGHFCIGPDIHQMGAADIGFGGRGKADGDVEHLIRLQQ